MTPEVRAIADRFIYEQATLKHLMTLVPEGGFERAVPGTDWTVRQTFAHLASSLRLYATTIRTWAGGGDPFTGWDTNATNAETARVHAATPAAEIVALFGAGLVELMAALADVSEEAPLFGPWPFADALGNLCGHSLAHAMPLVQAVPEARMDALVLNWVLDAKFEDEATRSWQSELLAEAREYVASLPQEEDEE